MRKIAIIIFGLFSSLVGLISILTAITLMIMSVTGNVSKTGDTVADIYIAVSTFIFSELFLAFGIATFLFGLRCFLGRRDWITKTIDYTWNKAMRFALILPMLALATIIIWWLIRLISSL
jgi:hypothetical protein